MSDRRPLSPRRRRPFRSLSLALAVAALLAAACGATSEQPFLSNPTVPTTAAGGPTTTTPADPACDVNDPGRSLAPQGLAVGAGTYMDTIKKRGFLNAGVGADTLKFGFLNPETGNIEGFDVEMARLVAKAIFGNDGPEHIKLIPLQSSERIAKLKDGSVDLVVKTMTINCDRWGSINFSAVYYNSGQQLLVSSSSPVETIEGVPAGDKICAVSGTTSLANLKNKGIATEEVGDWTDCLVEFQQGQVVGISTDDTILAGLAAQDPYAKIVGPKFTTEPYGIGLPKGHDEFTRFVNAVLAQAITDGTWKALFDQWLAGTLPNANPPQASYR